MPPVSYTYLDFSGEQSRVSFDILTLNAGNFAGQTGPVVEGGALEAALSALSLCTLQKVNVSAISEETGNVAPVSPYAQREHGLLVTYQDTVNGKKYSLTIPGPDYANLAIAGTDQVNPAAAAWTAFVTAFEANAHSELGNTVTVLGGRFVGRSR